MSLGLGAVAEQFAEQEEHASLEHRSSVIDGLQNAVLVVFREFDAVAGMVRIGGPVVLVLVPDIVRVFRVVIDKVLEVGAPSLRVVQPPCGPFRPCFLCHIRVGIGVQFLRAPVGHRLGPLPNCNRIHLMTPACTEV